jgi:neutral ceramidase
MNLAAFRLALLLLAGLLAAGRASGAEALWKAGIAKAIITPTEPLWLAGYASRTNAAQGKVMELWVKVLALEDAHGHRGLILTSDTLGIPQPMYQHVRAALKEKFGLDPAQVMLSASHTHCGPVLHGALSARHD